jgi:hypothetical protein
MLRPNIRYAHDYTVLITQKGLFCHKSQEWMILSPLGTF